LSICGLPVYRDAEGGVGTPTSDNERTKMTLDTRHLVVLINGYDGNEQRVRENAEYIQQLLRKYCQSDGGSYFVYKWRVSPSPYGLSGALLPDVWPTAGKCRADSREESDD
jgi:hypothetical protein